MFICVRFRDDGVRMVVTADKIKKFDINNIDFDHAYKVLYTDEKYYRAHLICTAETEADALLKAEEKRFRIPKTLFDESSTCDELEESTIITKSKKECKDLKKAALHENYSNILQDLTNVGMEASIPSTSDKTKIFNNRTRGIKTLNPEDKEMNSLKMEISILKTENGQLKEEINVLSKLNKELQSVVIEKFKNLELTATNGGVQPPLELELPTGTRLDGNIHLGRNVWLPCQIYDSAANKPKKNNYSLLIKEIAYAVFGERVLMESSVSGRKCNRTKTEAKPALDGTKLMAVHDIIRYTLEKNGDSLEKINAVVDSINHRVGEKMQDLIKPKIKGRLNEESIDDS
ncbi:unnamed protein product [Brassicogethes aeneus]|uniref:BEN domain-containing protein n=1 Tax=Brassicogethes aeneus TaxID=1431903 RepID=A0A9P0FJ85_BRAAE|nr:unnamed protein product [Brassicogethes aeneus]